MRVLLLFLILLSPAWAIADDMVRRFVPPYPDGMDSLVGSCVGDPESGEDICGLSIATLNDAAGLPVNIHAARLVERRDDGMPIWFVTDVLPLPVIGEGYLIAIGECRLNRVADSAIIAVARHDPDVEYATEVSWAARLDRSDGTLSEIDTAGIDCIFPGS